MGLEPETVIAGLAELKGVGRRFEKKGEARGVTFLDDYGHHPTEIRATLSALTECFPRRRRVVVFQPHRHSRTQSLFNEFIPAFNQTDRLIVTDIYGAGETPVEGVEPSAATGTAMSVTRPTYPACPRFWPPAWPPAMSF